MTKIILCGSQGRMGQEIKALIDEDRHFDLIAEVDPQNKRYKKLSDVGSDCHGVVIDFSNVNAFSEILKVAAKRGWPVVSGTTGLTAKDKKLIDSAAKKVPVLWAPNMSVGIAFFKSLLRSFGGIEGFDFQVLETHHTKKKDAPSGTALLLQEELQAHVRSKLPPPISLRLGGVLGIHEVIAASQQEIISIKHEALNRKVFAEGALKAAAWLKLKKNGRYCIEDMVKITE